MKKYRIAPEFKEQILTRIKNEGVSVLQAAEDHGVSTHSIYKWLGGGADALSCVEMAKLRRENKSLPELVGEMTLKLSETQKRIEKN
ncbi:MAG: transposase [Candidatus Niyogibacteria bacterium]|nr:transposase [Candidatus Niyogibacteria bacterium]